MALSTEPQSSNLLKPKINHLKTDTRVSSKFDFAVWYIVFLAKINNFHIQYNRQISLKSQKDQACQTESILCIL